MSGDDILALAAELFASKIPKSEALCRTIISRSYYGAYHLAISFFNELGLPKTSNHAIAARWLTESGERNAQVAGRFLETLYAARRRADYELQHPQAIRESHDLKSVKGHVELATDIKSLLALCAVEPARSELLAGIHAYRARVPKPS